MGKEWYDKLRKCDDGTQHEGKLELITWGGRCTVTGERLGWGACSVTECNDLREKFEVQYKGNEKAFFKYWPQGFRWTCCGMEGDATLGCDHHGSGAKPCQCDFCTSGKALTDGIFYSPAPHRVGLVLCRGPDPRSFNPYRSAINEEMRAKLGLSDEKMSSTTAMYARARQHTVSSLPGGLAIAMAVAGAELRVAEAAAEARAAAGGGSSSSGDSTEWASSRPQQKLDPEAAALAAKAAKAMISGEKQTTCSGCGVEAKQGSVALKMCAQCRCVRYCCPACQKGDWTKHRTACKQMAEAMVSAKQGQMCLKSTVKMDKILEETRIRLQKLRKL